MDKLPTYIPTHIPQRQEAVDLGLHFYGEVREVYKDADEDEFEATLLFMLGRLNNVVTTRQEPSSGEILGTCISMITVDTDKIVLATLVERAHCRNKRSYSHQVKKSSKREAATIHHWDKMMASRPISS